MKFEFLSTVVNQGTIIRIENIIIVNKIDKFNISGFETPRLIPNGPLSTENGPIEDAYKFTILIWLSIHNICYFCQQKYE